MSLRTTIYWGRLGHVCYNGSVQAYWWEPRKGQGLQLPLLWPWRLLARWTV